VVTVTNKKLLIRLVLGFFIVAYLSRALLDVLNQYAVSTVPTQETVIVKGVGTFYNPFRNDYLSGQSTLLKKTVHVPVLPDVAANTAIGRPTQIMVGDGLLRKRWVASKERYEGTSDRNFRTGYIAVFVLLFAVGSVACLRLTRALGKVTAVQIYGAGLAVGALLFYLF
jgi:hypothetical protein